MRPLGSRQRATTRKERKGVKMEAGDLVQEEGSQWHAVVIGFSKKKAALDRDSTDIARIIWLHDPLVEIMDKPSSELIVVGNVGGHHVV